MNSELPHDPEAEDQALACVLWNEPGDTRDQGFPRHLFYQLEASFFHRAEPIALCGALAKLAENDDPLTRDSVAQELRNTGNDHLVEYLDSLPGKIASPESFEVHLRALKRLAAKRERITDAKIKLRAAWKDDHDDDTTTSHASSISFASGLAYDVAHDPNALLGMRDGKTTRYICRGYGAWQIGPSGVGKSVLLFQQGCMFTMGRPIFGITPVRPLRTLIVQAENDDGDVAEMMKGAAAALNIGSNSVEYTTLNTQLKVLTEGGQIGEGFCRWLGREIEKFGAEIVQVDPLLSFAGIDVSRQDQCSRFLRNWLNPMLADTGAAMIGAHHTGKPKSAKDTRTWTAIDYAYAGLGSSELVNWARAISLIVPHEDAYELKLLKRGNRAGATHPNGEPTTSVWMRHSINGLWWEQIDPPAAPAESEPQKGGAPSKVDRVLALGLGTLIDSLTEPVGKNELARRIEDFAGKGKVDVSLGTCKSVVERLVTNGAIKKAGGSYVKS